MKHRSRIPIAVLISFLGVVLRPALAADEQGLPPRPTRAPVFSPGGKRLKPMPSPSVSSSPAGNDTASPNGQSQYMTMPAGAATFTGDQLTKAFGAKLEYVGANGWELITVYDEGGGKVFLYKRKDVTPRWQYMGMVEGANIIEGGQLTEVITSKIDYATASGWELVTVFCEGGKKVFIYKRKAG